jgi:uncharacterized protein YndB with AHSA1/START domain
VIEPIHATVTVHRTPEDAFRIFTREMGSWWPLQIHSIAEDTHGGDLNAETVIVEEREGGRVFERLSDGSEAAWATILVWDPPRRLVLAWKPNLTDKPPTELEVTFTPIADVTRVDLDHRGWERLGPLAEEAREIYGENWDGVLALFVAAAEQEGVMT